MHIYSAAVYVCAGTGLVPLVLIISSFVLLNVTGMVWLVAVTLLAHHTGRRGGGLPIGGGRIASSFASGVGVHRGASL